MIMNTKTHCLACAFLVFSAFGQSTAPESAADKPSAHYSSFKEAQRDFLTKSETTNFSVLTIARGTTTFFHPFWGASNNGQPNLGTNGAYRAIGANGSLVSRSDQCPWGWHSGVKSRCGHLLSYPAPGSDFTVEKTFTYMDANKVATGKYVRVDAVISAPNDCHLPTETECYTIIKRLAETGFNGYLSLRAAAKMRFGSSDVYPHYGRTDSAVGLLCKNCRPHLAWDCVKPVWKTGQKRTR